MLAKGKVTGSFKEIFFAIRNKFCATSLLQDNAHLSCNNNFIKYR